MDPNQAKSEETTNVAARLAAMARKTPEATAVVEPLGYGADGRRQYAQVMFRELDQDSDRIARGLRDLGVQPGTRLALLVRPGIDFISLVFGLLKAGVVSILIDPGMGRRNLIRCLAEAEPEGFVAIPPVHAVRTLLPGRFPKARFNVTVGRRWFWGGVTLEQLRGGPHSGPEMAATTADDPAAIIFTTGSTGPPKGVLYRHDNFDAQVHEISRFYGIEPGEVDVPGFPLFGLFNCAMGVTAVIPDMDPTRPARVDPRKILEAVTDYQATQTFGSPAIWNVVGRHCEEQGDRLSTVRRVLSAGAPVPVHVLQRMRDCIHPDGEMHTPYGATEALPVSSISAGEVLDETAERTAQGAGVCVGSKFPGIEWGVIRIVEGPIETLADAEPLPEDEIGELIVTGPVVTREYITKKRSGLFFRNGPEGASKKKVLTSVSAPFSANALAKIADGERVWHRMGDSGYIDDRGRFWFCGRVAHRVLTAEGPMYPVRCEAIFNNHPDVYRSALVGVGPAGRQRPVIVVEPLPESYPRSTLARGQLVNQLEELARSHPVTRSIRTFLVHKAFPVDIRHNAKIFREKLAIWAAKQVGGIA